MMTITHDTGNLNKEIETIKKEWLQVLRVEKYLNKREKPLDEINKINRYKVAEERINMDVNQ